MKRWINTISQDLIILNLTPVETQRIGMSVEEEPMYLTPHMRDSQPEG